MSLLKRYNIELVLANLLLGFNYSVIISLLDNWFSAGELLVMQTIAGGIIFIPVGLWVGEWRRVSYINILQIILFSIINIYGWSWLMLKGGEHTSAIDMATIATLAPAITLIVAHLKHTRRVTSMRIMGIIVSLFGALALVKDHLQVATLKGNLIILCAVTTMAVLTVLIKPLLLKVGVRRYLAIYFLSGIISLPWWGIGEMQDIFKMQIPRGVTIELLWFLTLGSTLPLFLLYLGGEILSPLKSAIYKYLQPLIAIIVIYVKGEEGIDHANYIAIAILLLGGALVSTGGRG